MTSKITDIFGCRKDNQVWFFWSWLLYLFIQNWLIHIDYCITFYICNTFHLQRTPRVRGGGRKPPNHGGRGVHVDEKSSLNTKIPPFDCSSNNHEVYTSYLWRTPTSYTSRARCWTSCRRINSYYFFYIATMNQPSLIQDSLTPEYESVNVVDQRPWLHT